MKPALFTLSFLLFAFALAFSNDDAQPLLDTNGNPVVPGSEYYILPIILAPTRGGGLTLGITGNSTCPVTVVVNSKIYPGLPVNFSILRGPSTDEIFPGTPLEIEFAKKPPCAKSSKWTIFDDNDIQKAYIGIGGPEDHPRQQNVIGTFFIGKSSVGVGYNLAFCKGLCSKVGRYFLDGPLSLLVLTRDEPNFFFVLKKVEPFSGIRTVV